MENQFSSVISMLMDYLDGIYFSDTARLKRVLHPKAHYVSVTDGELLYRTIPEYIPIVDRRPSPASRNETRRDHIESIEFAGPVTAFVRLRCSLGNKFFTDLLTLIRDQGRWQIISKVFHYDLI